MEKYQIIAKCPGYHHCEGENFNPRHPECQLCQIEANRANGALLPIINLPINTNTRRKKHHEKNR